MIKWIFFDLGSTLLDESSRVQEMMEATAARLGLKLNDFEAMMERAAPAHPYALKMELPGGAAWEPWPKRLDPLYPGVPELLQGLHKRYHLGVIANHGVDTAQPLGIAQYLDVIVTSEELGFGKPDPRLFTLALERAHCAPEEALMAGDRLDNDIVPAKQLGMQTLWVRQGWGGKFIPMSEEFMPDWQVDRLEDMLTCFD